MIAAISKSVVTQYDIDDINEVAPYFIAPTAWTWTPATFNGTRSNANWAQQSVFALDFDNGFTPEQALAITDKYGIVPNIIYSSFSDTPTHRKFRVLFFLDQSITEKDQAKFIQLNLMNMFEGNADKACKDYARMFYGGKELLFLSNEEVNTEKLMDILNTVQIATDKMQTRKVYNFAAIGESSYSYKDDTRFTANSASKYNDGKMIEHFDFDKAKSEVMIFNDFLNGKWLTHSELFGIATNLCWIKGGAKLMKESMQAANTAGTAQYSENNFGIIPYVNKVQYTPQRLENFSPYTDDHQHLNIISSVRTIKGEVVATETIEVSSLSTAEAKFKEEFDKALKAESGIFLFKVPTGLGKTAALETVTDATLAFPTHNLKNEVSTRMKVEHKATPELPAFTEQLSKRLEFLNRVGLTKKANSLLFEVAKDAKNENYIFSDVAYANTYINDTRTCYNSADTILTTHQKAVFSGFKHNTIIFDEDPMTTLLSIKSVKIGDLVTIEGFDNTKVEVRAIIDYLRHQLPAAQIIEMPTFSIDYDAIVENILLTNVESNIIDFLDATHIIKDAYDANVVHFIVKRELPKAEKVIVMSATASEFIYRKIFGDKLVVIDLMDVEQVGQVVQNTKLSFSRESIKTHLEGITKAVGELPCITFSAFKKNFDNPVEDMHFGNCSGYDTLNGKDIAVVGTPHLPNFVYFLYAKALGVALTNRDNSTSYQLIEWNGFKFKFNTYDNEDLRSIQLSLIESELVQAVGRNRTLRQNCTAYLYSNLPLRQTTKFIK
jgi:hypothetical protein